MANEDIKQNNFRRSAADNIDVGQIGKGKYLTVGAWGGKSGNRGWGLKGQLGIFKRSGFRTGETKNISKKNLEDMEKLIADRLGKHTKGYQAQMTRRDKKTIMAEAEKMVKTKDSKFSRQDKKDLKNIVETIYKKGRENIISVERSSSSGSAVEITETNSHANAGIPPNAVHINPPITNHQALNSFQEISEISTPGNQTPKNKKNHEVKLTDPDYGQFNLPLADQAEDLPIYNPPKILNLNQTAEKKDKKDTDYPLAA